MFTHFRAVLLAALVLTAALLVTGCSDDEESSGESEASSDREGMVIEFAMVGVPGDPFYTVIKNGAAQAGEDLGIEVTYNETQQYDFQEQARLIRTVAAKEPDAMIVSDENPEVLDPVITEVVDSGIPVMITNFVGDGNSVVETGSLGFVGQDEEEVGRFVGEALNAEGVQRPLCLDPAPGALFSVLRIRGLRSVYGDALDCIPADQTNRTAARNAVLSALPGSDADAIVGLSISTNEPALDAVAEAGVEDEVEVAGIDLSPKTLEAIDQGQMLFTSDQQQYLQGYLPVMFLALHLQYGFQPPAFTKTGPSLVTPENALDVLELSEDGIR